MELRIDSTVLLNDGVPMPRLGLGVWKCTDGEARDATLAALSAGYRHVDTAYVYDNERDVGEAVRAAVPPRDAVFVTTKLWTTDHGAGKAAKAFEESATNLGLGAVDLFLSHFPVSGRRVETWKALLELKKTGKVRSVGVSNYTIRHLREIMDATGVAPSVNQIELHPYLTQPELTAFCAKAKIQVVAYSPLTHGLKLGDPKLLAIAAHHPGKSAAQVLIRWALQHGYGVIPKSANPRRIFENAQVFDFALSAADMAALDGFNEDLRTCWDPSEVP